MDKRIKIGLWAVALLAVPALVVSQAPSWFGNRILTGGNFTVRDGYVRVGIGSTPDVTPGQDDIFVEGTLEVDGAARFDGVITATAGLALTGGLSGVGDITAATGLAGGWDFAHAVAAANTAGQTTDITGQAGGTAGTDLDGAAGGAVTVTPGAGSALNGGGSNDGSGGDLVLLGGAKGGATGSAVDGIVRVGSPTVGSAKTTNLLAVAGGLEVDGASRLDGTLVVAGAATLSSTLAVTTSVTSAGDITATADATGGNAGAKTEVIGLPRIKLKSLGTMTNGTTETTSYVDDSPTGEYAPIDGDVTEAEGSVDGIFKYGSSSYKALFADTATADDGFKRTITGDDLEGNESIGILLYSSVTIAAADLQILLTDDGGARNFDIPAIATANKWTWVEVDISALAGGTGDVVTEFGITLTAQGEAALGAFNLFMDLAYKWDADDEEALGVAIQQDGVLSCQTVLTDTTGANTLLDLAELTDYVVHYESGSDFLVTVTNQSTYSGNCLLAY